LAWPAAGGANPQKIWIYRELWQNTSGKSDIFGFGHFELGDAGMSGGA
jgi:hypothetical protein